MNMIVAYDIANPRRLQRIAKIMEDYGMRVQKSIFEVEANDRSFAEMKRRAEKEMDWDEDGVKYFPLCEPCSGALVVLGVCSDGWDDRSYMII
jgi:CRISPR-associated protein Cas2